MKKNKSLTINCTKEHYDKIKSLSKKSGLSQSDYIVSKVLGLTPVIVEEIREYPNVVRGKKYTQKRVLTKTILTTPEVPQNWFLPVTDEDVKFVEEKYEKAKKSGYMSDEEFFALLDEE